ncbi:hypothetical protein RE628_04445 [Paenibacillus sp. D2_2]|uniref:hypothetical protein n=1 Tax=Paenibacillus sp. D2_2 TaxID=3073092 RepID=UPI002814F704|nr:hypothetical protein [Paenibacillus sp. D2_2]WMT41745.1 hypothetical protein RE628_04445 [Paenibacillus sp. D2_2]
MLTDEHFKKRIIGAINSYIRLINSSVKSDSNDEIISSQWKSHLEDEKNTFVATLKVNGKEELLYFSYDEWKTYDVDVLKNNKLKNLMKRFL